LTAAPPAAEPALDENDAEGRGRPWLDFVLPWGSFVVLLVGWEAAVRLLEVPAIVLPAPTGILRALAALIASGTLLPHLWVTLSEILLGFAFGAAAAFSLGALMAQMRLAERLLLPYVVALQSIPKVAIAPLLVIWFGFGIESKVIMTAVIAFFPIIVNTAVGLKTVEPERIELMIALNASAWQAFRFVRLPSALPFIFAGLDVGIVLAVIGAIVGEFVGASAGIGYLILVYNADLKIDAVFALLIVLAAVGVSLHMAVLLVQRRVMFWSQPAAVSAAAL
jgi:NitT/TauT family transport system permease protein